MTEEKQGQLLEYYLGSISDEGRLLVEEQLLHSQATLLEFIAMKRSLELFPEEEVSLSPSVKEKIRLDLESAFVKGKRPPQPTSLFKISGGRRFFNGAVAAGIFLSVLLGKFLISPSIEKVPLSSFRSSEVHPESGEGVKLIDSSGASAVSFHFL